VSGDVFLNIGVYQGLIASRFPKQVRLLRPSASSRKFLSEFGGFDVIGPNSTAEPL
jgi:hypothetical protein